MSFIGADGPNDVSPSGGPGVGLHQLALVAMGISIFDNLDFERAVEEARRLNRYEFLFMAAPLRIEKGMGSPLNPLQFLKDRIEAQRAGHVVHDVPVMATGNKACTRS